MSLTYSAYVAVMQNLLKAQNANGQAILQAMLPSMIDYAELRINRDLDFLSTQVVRTYTCVTGSRNIVTQPGDFVVIEQATCITPQSTLGDAGTRNPMLRSSKSWIDMVCPTQTIAQSPQIPKYWYVEFETTQAIPGSPTASIGPTQSIIFGPAPDQTYDIEFTGTSRPAPLSAGNPETFISAYLPDLFIAASMIYGAGYQRDFGAQADNPQMALSWSQEYDKHLEGAMTEEFRKKAQSWSWQSKYPARLAGQPLPQD